MRERNPAFLCFALCHRTVVLSSLMLSCDLIALPDELLLSCVDMSLRTCVMLAGTSKAIRAKLSDQAKARGLRLMCYSAYDALRIEHQMRGHFHIGALLLTFFGTTGITDRNVT